MENTADGWVYTEAQTMWKSRWRAQCYCCATGLGRGRVLLLDRSEPKISTKAGEGQFLPAVSRKN